jgi:hypothetical protein
LFDDWIVEKLVGHDPLVNIEGGGLMPVENCPKMQSSSFPQVWKSWDRVWTLPDLNRENQKF